jgi:chromosome partitioning protein
MLIAATNVKGGVGKSLLACHLAAWVRAEGVEVAFMDSDVQETSSRWLKEAEPEIPVVRVINPNDVRKTMTQLRRQYRVVVVDGPAGLADVTLRILLATDMALVPCGPTPVDIEASQLAVQVIKEAQEARSNGLPQALLIANRIQLHTKLSQELLTVAADIGIPRAHMPIRLRQVYAECRGLGKTVFQMGYRGKEAADDLRALFEEVFRYGTERNAQSGTR